MAGKRRRRRIVAQTQVPGVSVSQVARRYDVNANLVFKWVRDRRYQPTADAPAPCFLPVEVITEPAPALVEPPALAAASEARIEIALANGHRLSMSGAFDPDVICRLVRGLGG